MSTSNDRLEAVQAVYLDASNNEPHDLAAAQTAADVTAIQANVANARSSYFAAAAAVLTNDGPDVETAYTQTQTALAAVIAARAAAAQIATLLGQLNTATQAASNLLSVAKT